MNDTAGLSIVVGLLAALGVSLMVLQGDSRRQRRIGIRAIARGAIVATGAGVVTQLLMGIPMLSAITALASIWVPKAFLRQRVALAHRRRADAWPDAIDHLVSALRAGVAMPSALESLVTSAPEVLRPALAALSARISTGMPTAKAIAEWREEVADPVVDRITMTISVALDVGGRSLPSVLASLANYLRVDGRTRAELLARQAWTVHAARLAVVAPWLMLVILGSRAQEAYRTPTGAVILIIGAAACVLGYIWMSSVSRLPRETRLFA